MNRITTTVINLALLFLLGTGAQAATFTVTKTADTNDGNCDADCSLREAVSAANSDGAPSTINFAASLAHQTVLVTGGDMPTFTDALTINGPGANLLTISGGGVNRLFDVNNPAFTLTGVTITACNGNGLALGDTGGAISSFGTSAITLDNVYFVANSASTQAGVLYFGGGTLNISNSTFAGNSSPQGAVFNLSGGTVTIKNSTFSGNTASSVAGAFGVFAGANVTVTNSTIASNTGANGGGIYISNGTLTLGNTVLAGNTATSSFPEIWYDGGIVTSAGNNHIGDSAGDSTATNFLIT